MEKSRLMTEEDIKFNVAETSGIIKINIFNEEIYNLMQNYPITNTFR